MDDIAAKAIVIGIFIFMGFFVKVLLDKINVNIKNLNLFSLMLWCVGMGIGYIGYIAYEQHGASFLSYSLITIGWIFHKIVDTPNSQVV